MVVLWRGQFETLETLVEWYNEEKSHGALNLDIAEMSSHAFVRKRRSEVW